MPIATQDDDLWRLPRHNGNTFAVRLDSRQLRQVAQSGIGCLDKSILTPASVLFQRHGYDSDARSQLLRDCMDSAIANPISLSGVLIRDVCDLPGSV